MLARKALKEDLRVLVESIGADSATNRFDAWELAAARTASIARMFRANGVPEEQIDVSIPRMTSGQHAKGQHIAIILKPRTKSHNDGK